MDSTFGNWIKLRRKALDLTQQELAHKVGCSPSLIFKIEADQRRPSRQVAELLARHLEIQPDQRDLFLRVARQEKGVSDLGQFLPLTIAGTDFNEIAKSGSLPKFPGLLVGRDIEIRTVINQLHDPVCRLLTITGTGGVGKTRLAVEVARQLADEFPDGVHFISLEDIQTPESIFAAMADGLGIVFSGPAVPRQQILNHLRDKEALLVIDNFEHLLDSSDFLDQILQTALAIKLLMTSRVQTNLQWEWVFELQGLPVPQDASEETLAGSSAAALFIQRASQASHNFTLAPEDFPSLVQICQWVDGLPLAIELAASWVRSMSIRSIATELERNLDLLESTPLDLPVRHRSFKTVFDHSWRLLNEAERTALRRLSVCHGGFSRLAAEVIADVNFMLLSSLVRKSLLHFNQVKDQYGFHELIRQYSNEQLMAHPGENSMVLEKHGAYYAGLLANLETNLKSHQQVETSHLIRSKSRNWIAAWRWAVQNRRFDLLRQMLPSMAWYYEIHGYFVEALSLSEYAVSELRIVNELNSFSTSQDQSTFAHLLNQLGWFVFRIGTIERAVALFGESLQLSLQAPDDQVMFYIYNNWGYLSVLNGDIEGAERLLTQSLILAHKLGSQWSLAVAFTTMGILEFHRHNLAEANSQLGESLQLWREVGDPRGLVFCMLYKGSTALALGEAKEAEDILEECSALAQKNADQWAYAFGLNLLGHVAKQNRKLVLADAYFQQSLKLSRAISDHWMSTQNLIHLAATKAALGARPEADGLFLQAFIQVQREKWATLLLELTFALIESKEDLTSETRLAVIWSILSNPATPPLIHEQAQRRWSEIASQLTPQQVNQSRARSADIYLETWVQEILN